MQWPTFLHFDPGSPQIKSESLHKAVILIPSGEAQARSGTDAAIFNGRSEIEKRSETVLNCNKMTMDETGRRAFENHGIT